MWGRQKHNAVPEIGKEIPWVIVLSMVFRVVDFDRNNTVITDDGKVKAASIRKPYGYLLVESPILKQPVRLPIIHRDDFILAASVFGDPDVVARVNSRERELLVTYQPEKTTKDGRSAGFTHCLHYVLVPYGSLERYYATDQKRSEPELLFGRFIYQGEIRVAVNLNPDGHVQ